MCEHKSGIILFDNGTFCIDECTWGCGRVVGSGKPTGTWLYHHDGFKLFVDRFVEDGLGVACIVYVRETRPNFEVLRPIGDVILEVSWIDWNRRLVLLKKCSARPNLLEKRFDAVRKVVALSQERVMDLKLNDGL